MPLVGFRPTVARLVIEDTKESVLVMKVIVDPDDAVDLAAGGTLQDLQGVLRIRERRAVATADKPIGTLVYVAPEGSATMAVAKFQVNVSMAAEKFAMLLRVASAGRLPTKFFVDAGQRGSADEKPGLSYRVRAGHRTKIWDNHVHRTLAVANFVMILPIDVPIGSGTGGALDAAPAVSANDARIADLADDLLVFQSDTRNSMFGLVCVIAVVAVAALVIGLAQLFR
jgi:hypothetical protein